MYKNNNLLYQNYFHTSNEHVSIVLTRTLCNLIAVGIENIGLYAHTIDAMHSQGITASSNLYVNTRLLCRAPHI